MNREELFDLIAAHMMRGVSERYALLQKVGVPFDFLTGISLSGTPGDVSFMLLGKAGIVDWMGNEEGLPVLERLKAERLPKDIKLPVR